MPLRVLAFLSVLTGMISMPVRAEIVVIVNQENAVASLKREQVVDLFMGRDLNFPDGSPASPIDQSLDSRIRADYYQAMVGKTVAQVNAYWARLVFTGRATPPRVMRSMEAILKTVRENRDAIAYIDSEHLDAKVKVVFRVK